METIWGKSWALLVHATLLLTALLTYSGAHAQMALGTPNFRGNGCTGVNSVSAALSPDLKTLSVLFDGFTAQAGQGTNVRMHRASCIIDIPVSVSAGVQVAIAQADTRGFNALPIRGYSQYTTQYSLNGQTMPMILRRVTGPVNEEFVSVNRLRQQDIKWSPCGQSARISINTSVVVQSNERNEQVMSTIDSNDLRGGDGIEFHILYRNCR